MTTKYYLLFMNANPGAAAPACDDADEVATELFVGDIRPLPESGRATGMYKSALRAPARLDVDGFDVDHQADLRVHGGPEKAVHLYPSMHLARLAARFPHAAAQLVPGSIGENLSAALDESAVRVGEVWSLGEALLQICQPRNPCWKIDERFASPGMAAYIVEARITGWYWRVVRGGVVQPGDALRRQHGASAAPTLREALELWHAPRPDADALARLAAVDGIAAHWRHKIEQRLDWLARQR